MSIAATVAQFLAAGGVGGFLAELGRGFATRRQIKAQAEKTGVDANVAISNAAIAMLEPAREQVEFLRGELNSLRTELQTAHREADELRSQLAEAQAEVTSLRIRLADVSAERRGR